MSAHEARVETERLAERLALLQSRAERVTSTAGPGGAGRGQGPEALWAKLADERRRFIRQLELAQAQEAAVEQLIRAIRPARVRILMRLHWLDGFSVREASQRLGFSYSYGRRLSSQGLLEAERLLREKSE
jgi:DNA-directed RNA polymerase specialized sigma24 family protein